MREPERSGPIAPRQMNVTARSSKADIIDAAMELTSTQADRIEQLEQRQSILIALLAIASILLLMR